MPRPDRRHVVGVVVEPDAENVTQVVYRVRTDKLIVARRSTQVRVAAVPVRSDEGDRVIDLGRVEVFCEYHWPGDGG